MRDAKKWGKKLLFLKSSSELSRAILKEDCICTIKFEKCFLDLMLSDQSSDTTIIFFHAALTKRAGINLPIFSGARLGAGLQANKIFVSDPSLYLSESLRLGWFLGNKYLKGEEEITFSLLEILKKFNTKKVILFGASAGGFAAILYGKILNKISGLNVLSVAVNPQTNILKFSKRPVEDYFGAAWGVDVDDHVSLNSLGVNYNFNNDLQALDGLPLLYIQNTADHHYYDHFTPFLNSCNVASLSDNKFILSDWFGEGHVSPPMMFLKDILSDLVSLDLSVRDLQSAYKIESFSNYNHS